MLGKGGDNYREEKLQAVLVRDLYARPSLQRVFYGG